MVGVNGRVDEFRVDELEVSSHLPIASNRLMFSLLRSLQVEPHHKNGAELTRRCDIALIASAEILLQAGGIR